MVDEGFEHACPHSISSGRTGPSQRTGRPRLLLHFPQLRLKYVIDPVSPLLGVKMYPISGEREVINHAQHVLEIQKPHLARVVSHQTADHFVPPCHVAIHKICRYGAHNRVLWYRAQHHEPGPVLLL